MKLHSCILTTIISLSSLLPCYGSEGLKGGEEISQSSQIRRDGILLQQILTDTHHDPEAYDIRYSQLIDPMMESLQPDTTSEEFTSYQKIKGFI